MKGMEKMMEKIIVKAFDRRRNQIFWFHFCYLPKDLWNKCRDILNTKNLDTQIKEWVKQDFNFDINTMEDVYEAKDLIKQHCAECYPEIFLDNEGDRQGWARVWLTAKLIRMLEDNHG